jgi:uncharacterized protein YhjY with autotransporter beta-barrel domain
MLHLQILNRAFNNLTSAYNYRKYLFIISIIISIFSVPSIEAREYNLQSEPTVALSIKDIFFNVTNTQYWQLTERLEALREGVYGGGISLNGLSQEPMMQEANEMRIYEKSGKNPSSLIRQNNPASPFNFFANASGIFSRIINVADLHKHDALTGYFSAGGDYRINKHMSAGVYAGYQGMKSWASNRSWVRSNGMKFGLYSTGKWGGFYGNAILGGGFNCLELKRAIYLGRRDWYARSSPTVWELDSLLGGGYELPIGAWRFGINTSVQYTYLNISTFKERGADSFNAQLGRQNPNSLVSSLGGSIAYHWEPAPNYKIIPKIGLSWQHEFLNYGENISGTFDNGAGFRLTSARGGRNNAFGTVGFITQLGPRWGSYCYYHSQFAGGGIISHGLLLGLNYNF